MNGLPLLSYPPPYDPNVEDSACRKCNKEFNFLFSRQKRCNHCGYAYCTSCTDFQALMPREGADSGYDVLPVCAFCMDMLTITASSKHKLRTLPLSKLRSYMKAYDIRVSGAALEKDDLVEAILRAKGPNGCLLPVHEEFYRKNSVPQKYNERSRSRNFFSRSSRQETTPASTPQSQQGPHSQPPDPPPTHATHAPPPRNQQQYRPEAQRQEMPYSQPRHQQQYRPEVHPQEIPHSQPRPRQSPPQPCPFRPYATQGQGSANNFRPSTSQTHLHGRAPGTVPPEDQTHTYQPPPRSRSAAPTTPAPAPPSVPSLDSLLLLSPADVAHLSISTLKSILFENRVNTSLGVLEKEDLVRKVLALVMDERLDRQIREREDREEAERMEWARIEREAAEERRKTQERERKLKEDRYEGVNNPGETGNTAHNATPAASSTASPPFSEQGQDGLCVVCQDEHANMAIIDCGHLALCKGCSEVVMKSSRECPLCRTRIVTEQRLLRIFKA